MTVFDCVNFFHAFCYANSMIKINQWNNEGFEGNVLILNSYMSMNFSFNESSGWHSIILIQAI